ncbi:MAG: glutamate synthase subunit beta [Bacteroidota bacterium]
MMYEFTKIERLDPAVKPTNERIKNFEEINKIYSEEEAGVQASRCVQCGNPYCSSTGCPLNNNIPQWLKFIADKDLELAFNISNETSPFPEILGRICPHDRLCEGACTLNENDEGKIESHGAITIGSIEIAISERGFDKGLKPDFQSIDNNKKVAIIGSGPAGLSCANFLLRAGVKPVVYETTDQAGGLLVYGIPGFKLEKKSVQRRVKLLEEAGMELHLNTKVGEDISFEEIYNKHDAVFIAIGATEGRVLDYEAYNDDNIYMAVPFLTNIQKKLQELSYDRKFNVRGKNVLVIGGGDTAMDCVRTSVREGAASVKCVYRRDEESMPGSKKEVKSAKEEGVEFIFNTSPKRFIADKDKNIKGARFVNTELIPSEEGKRGKMLELEGSEHIIDADIIILALGFSNQKIDFFEKNQIQTNEWGAIIVDEKQQTSVERVYAGGDTVRGADLVVTAALDGREAALHIIEAIFEEE